MSEFQVNLILKVFLNRFLFFICILSTRNKTSLSRVHLERVHIPRAEYWRSQVGVLAYCWPSKRATCLFHPLTISLFLLLVLRHVHPVSIAILQSLERSWRVFCREKATSTCVYIRGVWGGAGGQHNPLIGENSREE